MCVCVCGGGSGRCMLQDRCQCRQLLAGITEYENAQFSSPQTFSLFPQITQSHCEVHEQKRTSHLSNAANYITHKVRSINMWTFCPPPPPHLSRVKSAMCRGGRAATFACWPNEKWIWASRVCLTGCAWPLRACLNHSLSTLLCEMTMSEWNTHLNVFIILSLDLMRLFPVFRSKKTVFSIRLQVYRLSRWTKKIFF